MPGDTSIRLSVVVCTANRCQSLGRLLKALAGQTADPQAFEVIIVNDGSTDATAGVLAAWSPAHRKKIIDLPPSGLAKARNAALSMACAPFVSFVDDDAIPSPDWIERTLQVTSESGVNVAAIGGRVLLEFEQAPPNWLTQQFYGWLSQVDWGDEARGVTRDETLAGTNLVFRTKALCAIGGFEVLLGRSGERLLSGEDTLACERLRLRGYDIIYEPKLVVTHIVPSERMSLSWFVRRSFWQGITRGKLSSFIQAEFPGNGRDYISAANSKAKGTERLNPLRFFLVLAFWIGHLCFFIRRNWRD